LVTGTVDTTAATPPPTTDTTDTTATATSAGHQMKSAIVTLAALALPAVLA
jgi:hypothetical protein